ncbi:MAG TPA: SDR family oxidoreductase [Sphingomonadaceae bacterium]|nr:SDR family oxidoreductase [Sphingomonadaceae bacterium]
MGILEGQVALVTGAGRGFGRAIAERFASEGAKVALLARSLDQLEDVAEAIRSAGGDALAIACDVTDPASIDAAVSRAESELGPVDLLVNNAGVPGPFGPIWKVDPEAWWNAQRIHIRAPMLFLHRVLPGMVERNRGRVICVSALASRMVAPNLSAYCTGKIAQNRIVAEAAAELAGTKVAVFAIDPGFAATQLARDTAADPDAQKYFTPLVERINNHPHAFGTDPDLARCAQRCLDLASGRYDALSGNYYELPDDLDDELAKLEKAE